jgi:hypothetical protein
VRRIRPRRSGRGADRAVRHRGRWGKRSIPVDLAIDPDRMLSAMAAFDASRARLFLTKPNVIEHVPRSLRVLRSLSRAQDELAGALRERVQQRREAIPSLPEIDPYTTAQRQRRRLPQATSVRLMSPLPSTRFAPMPTSKKQQLSATRTCATRTLSTK